MLLYERHRVPQLPDLDNQILIHYGKGAGRALNQAQLLTSRHGDAQRVLWFVDEKRIGSGAGLKTLPLPLLASLRCYASLDSVDYDNRWRSGAKSWSRISVVLMLGGRACLSSLGGRCWLSLSLSWFRAWIWKLSLDLSGRWIGDLNLDGSLA